MCVPRGRRRPYQPVSAREACKNVPCTQFAPCPKEPRIFLAEDSAAAEAGLRRLLDGLGGLQITAVRTTEVGATEWLHRNGSAWDLALIDLILREGSGFNLIGRCKGARPDGRVAVLSEYVTPVIRDTCLKMGADEAFRKSETHRLIDYLIRLGGTPDQPPRH